MTEKFKEYELLYKNALLNNVIPFWKENSIDTKFGGYFTCLDIDGTVYDTDKFIWLQARQVWTFSMLYNKYKKNEEWLTIAKHGIDFLKKYGRDHDGNWYFSLKQDGAPLVQPYNIFSDCFAALAFGEYAFATGDESCKDISLKTYHTILSRQHNPKGKYNKTIPQNRPLKSFSLPMILANLTLELRWLLGEDSFKEYSATFLDEIMNSFLDKESLLIRENVLLSGERLDSFEGRLLNPGHGIEGMGFVMDVAYELGKPAIINQAIEIVLSTLEFGWDQKHGGIFYFMDVDGKPPLSLEWDQKLWWVHLEALVTLLTAFSLTGDKRCWEWYEKIHNYTWEHFSDKKHGEWYGYLNRQGEPLLTIKGGKWKGFFHVPRSLFRNYQLFEKLAID
ncbi:N-acylglucosamine 2-epimerase [hydrothermal vent metagenome]|uniref:N-acylglucosamine 2-epimerase n=1 Tax=hydrothermal vent metagenome TaxID=652676 RepID=A0A3B0T100_9ZZZZ